MLRVSQSKFFLLMIVNLTLYTSPVIDLLQNYNYTEFNNIHPS